MSDLNELVGGVLASNLKTILGAFQSLPEGVQTFALAVVGIGTALAPVLISLSSLITLVGQVGIGAPLLAFFKSILLFLGPAGWIALAVIALGVVWYKWGDDISALVARVYTAIKMYLWDKLSSLIDSVTSLPAKVLNAFKAMANALIFHSVIPEMIDGFQTQFSRLDTVMVKPAAAAARDVLSTMSSMADGVNNAMVWNPGTKKFSPWAYGPDTVFEAPGWINAGGAGGGQKPPDINVTINMSGMMGTDDPQTRSMLRQLISEALMEGMRGSRLLGTA